MTNVARAMQQAFNDDRFRQWDELVHWLGVKVLMSRLAVYLYEIRILQLDKEIDDLEAQIDYAR